MIIITRLVLGTYCTQLIWNKISIYVIDSDRFPPTKKSADKLTLILSAPYRGSNIHFILQLLFLSMNDVKFYPLHFSVIHLKFQLILVLYILQYALRNKLVVAPLS